LTSEQRTRIRETVILSGGGPKVTRVTFPVRVGTVIPRSVRIVEVPEVIIDIHPEWRSFRYFVYEEEIVIIDPATLRIVAVITV